MTKKLYTSKPPIKACEWDTSQGGGAYIYFEEDVEIPGLEKADISICFEKNNSYEEVKALVSQMKSMGFTFAVQK
jgi:hypothetical protein